MLVHFSAQADLSEAETIHDWDERGWFVYRQLTAVADATQENAVAICRAFGGEPQRFWITNMILADGNLALAEALARLPEVRIIGPNRQFQLEKPVKTQDFGPSGDGGRAVQYSWGVTKIQAEQVWAVGYRGTGIVVAGADTGVKWDHAALKKSYRGWNGTTVNHDYNWRDAIHSNVPNSPAGNAACGFNSTVPCDDNSHGTHTVGTMTGLDSTSPENIYYFGVAPDAKWIACRNMDEGWGQESTYAECFQFFLAPTKIDGSMADPSKRPHVVNNSWSCPEIEQCTLNVAATYNSIDSSLNALRAAGTVMVVSAGNSGPSCNTINAPPATLQNAFDVGASNSSDGIAGFSSRGKVLPNAFSDTLMKPDVVAPGVSVYSCTIGGYASWDGTSMAGPHVAGAVALFLDAHPAFIGNPAGIEGQIRSNATSLGSTAAQTCNGSTPPAIPNPVWGWGRLNAFELLSLPVELLFFKAFSKNDAVQIDWATASETNADHFLIEKSRDGSTGWQQLKKVPAAGESQIEKRYQIIDNQPFTGRNFYRLTQIDRDGKSQKSALAQVNFSKRAAIRAYPNPVGDELTLALFSEKNADAELSVFDQNGRLVLKNPMPVVRGSMTCRVAVGDLPAGIYFLRLVENDRDILGEGRMMKN